MFQFCLFEIFSFPSAVFLKDVSHSALKDLIQFMYCGEVNVKQDALPAFISTAEALQIKGLTDVSTITLPNLVQFLHVKLLNLTEEEL